MKHYIFNIALSYLECENLYSSSIKSVVVTAVSGERVQIPSTSLRPFIEPTGIKGRFCLIVSKQNKIQSFTRNDA